MRLFKGLSRPSPTERSSPLDKLLSSYLAQAEEVRATAIVLGMPRERPSSVPSDESAAFQEELCAVGIPKEALNDSEAGRAVARSSRLKSTLGWRRVPVWMRINGVLYPSVSIPIEIHFAFLSLIQERLLSLDASEEDPKPMRFIEYDSPGDTSQRCFAEVEIWLDEDNTVRIEIVEFHRRPASTRAVPSVY